MRNFNSSRVLYMSIMILSLLIGVGSYSQDYGVTTLPSFKEDGEATYPFEGMIPMIPVVSEGYDPENEGSRPWKMEKTFNLMMEARVNVVVPLEIISDIDIKAMIIDNQKLEIPFEIEMNREPEKQDHYMLRYSETEIDIDGDGKVDTRIYSPKYINKKVVDDNLLTIDGENISIEGVHRKRVYITVEIKDGGK